jgi:hypothetical protein
VKSRSEVFDRPASLALSDEVARRLGEDTKWNGLLAPARRFAGLVGGDPAAHAAIAVPALVHHYAAGRRRLEQLDLPSFRDSFSDVRSLCRDQYELLTATPGTYQELDEPPVRTFMAVVCFGLLAVLPPQVARG